MDLNKAPRKNRPKYSFVRNQRPKLEERYSRMNINEKSSLIMSRIKQSRRATTNAMGRSHSYVGGVVTGEDNIIQVLTEKPKFYEQKVENSEYLRHTIGPGKTKKKSSMGKEKDKIWRSILLWEFLGCSFR